MKALFAKGGFCFEIRDVDIPVPKQGEVLVKVKACGLCGTDLHYSKDWEGDFVPLGHEISGEIVELGNGVTEYKAGDKVIVEDIAMCGRCESCKDGRPGSCRKGPTLEGQPGMSEYICVDSRLLNKFEGMDFTSASLVEPCAVAINAVINARIPLGGNVAVYGPGPIGLMCVRIAKLSGASKVALIGTTMKNKKGAARLMAGKKMGADFLVEGSHSDPVEAVKDYFVGGADSVIVTSPPKTMINSVRMTKYGGTVSFMGINLGGESKVELDINELVFNKVTLQPVFAEPALRFPASIRLLRDKLVNADDVISHTFNFKEAPDIIKASFEKDSEMIKAVLLPEK